MIRRQQAQIPLGVSIDESTASPLVQAGALEASTDLWFQTNGQARPRPIWDVRSPSTAPTYPTLARRGIQVYDETVVRYRADITGTDRTTTRSYARTSERHDLPVLGIDESGFSVVTPYESVIHDGAVFSATCVYDTNVGSPSSAIHLVRKDIATGQVREITVRSTSGERFMPRVQIHVVSSKIAIVVLSDAQDGSVSQSYDTATLSVIEINPSTLAYTIRVSYTVYPTYDVLSDEHNWRWDSDNDGRYIAIGVPDMVNSGGIKARVRLAIVDSTDWTDAWSKVGTATGVVASYSVEAVAISSTQDKILLLSTDAPADGIYSYTTSPLAVSSSPTSITRPGFSGYASCAASSGDGDYFAACFSYGVHQRWAVDGTDAGICIASGGMAITRPFDSGLGSDLILLSRDQRLPAICELHWVIQSEAPPEGDSDLYGSQAGAPWPIGRCATAVCQDPDAPNPTRPHFVDDVAWLTVPIVPARLETGLSQTGAVFGVDIAPWDNHIAEAIVQSQDAMLFADGLVAEHDGYMYSETGFIDAPSIISITGDGSSATTYTYTYQAVYEAIDARGMLHRSEPSASIDVTLKEDCASLTVTITSPLTAHWNKTDTSAFTFVRLFRADTGGTLRSVGVAKALPPVTLTNKYLPLTINDVVANEPTGTQAYWTGGAFADSPWPAPHTIVRHRDRVWAVSSEYRDQIWASKQLEFNVAPCSNAALVTRIAGATIHGLASLDQNLVALSSAGAHVIVGDGPNNLGAGVPWYLVQIAGAPPCSGGPCVVIPAGVVYRAESGLWLIGRDLSARRISDQVQNTLADEGLLDGVWVETLQTTALVTDSHLLALGDGGEWSVWTRPQEGLVRQVIVDESNLLVCVDAAADYWKADPDGQSAYGTTIKTPWLHPTGWDGFGRVRGVHIRGACDAVVDTTSHNSANLVSTSNLTVGGAFPIIDGVQSAQGMRLLLIGQNTGSQNGLWELGPATSWSRPTDYETGDHALNASVYVTHGTTYATTRWYCTTHYPGDVIDVDTTSWVQTSSVNALTMAVYYDRQTTAFATRTWKLSELMAAQTSGELALEWRLPRQKCTSAQLLISTYVQAPRWETMAIEFGQRAGVDKLQAGRH